MDLVLGQDALDRVAVQLALCALVGESRARGYGSAEVSKPADDRKCVETENRPKAIRNEMKISNEGKKKIIHECNVQQTH